MTTYTVNPNGDFRNEGWTFAGADSTLNATWSSGVDANYAANPGTKGRAAVTFPTDLTNSNIPFGSCIESVSVVVRAANTDSTSRLTVNVLSTDNTGQFTQRSIPLTTTPTTYTVGTYTSDPLRKAWSRDRLNRLILQVFSYSTTAGTVRVYDVNLVVNYRTQPAVQVTAPSGTVVSASPTISWTYSQNDGDPQQLAEYKIFTGAQVAAAAFNPDFTPSAYPAASTHLVVSGDTLFGIAAAAYGDGDLWPVLYAASSLSSGDPNLIFPGETVTIPGLGVVEGDISSLTLPFALAQNSYYLYVKVTSTHGVVSPWASRAFTVGGGGAGSPGNPGGTLGGIGTGGGGGFESTIADATTSNVFVDLRDGSNLFGVQQADFETLTDSIDWVGTNVLPAQDLTTAFGTGGASMKLAALSAANMSVQSDWIEIAASAPLTLRAQALAAATGRVVNLSLAFADDYYNTVGSTLTQAGSDTTGSSWTETVLTGTSPIGCTRCQATIQVVSPANGEVHNFDHIGLMYGTNSAYSAGGHASRNLLTSAQCNADDPVVTEPYTANSGTTYSRVATTGTGSDGLKAYKILYAGLSATISYVATGTAFTDTSSSASYTLNKPAGVANGDVLVAYVAADSTGATGVCTQALAPAGWTLVDSTVNGQVSLSVLIHDGLAADPSTWTGQLTWGATQVRKRAFVVAYRGAAPCAYQFPNENVSNSTSGSLVATTPSVWNADAGAWRLSAFAVEAGTTGGSMTANITPSSSIPPIAFVSAGTAAYGSNTSSNNYVINRPANMVSGDLMVAALQLTGNVTVNPPTGWIKVNSVNGNSSLAIMVRTAGSSEPTSWTGSTVTNGGSWVSTCVAYRNCDIAANQFVASAGQELLAATFWTPIVTNTNSKSWRVCIFGLSSNGGSTLSNDEFSFRTGYAGAGYPAATLDVSDSNGPCSNGTYQHTAVAANDGEVNSGNAWMGFLKPATTGGTPGAGETERQDVTAGSATPWLTLAGYDSNGVAPLGNTNVYGTFAPGSGSTTLGTAAFLGFLIPSSSAGVGAPSGEASCMLSSYIDISQVDPQVLALAGNQVTVTETWLGSTVSTPHMHLYAYTANEQISVQVSEGSAYNTTTWTKSIHRFVLPAGTTRLKIGPSAINLAVNDYALFDRVSVSLGNSTVYRPGTGSTAQPIFDRPLIEFQEDLGNGYGDWSPLLGVDSNQLTYDSLTGVCSFVDQTVTPLSARQYRARTQSFGIAGDTFMSNYGPVSNEVTLVADNFWLKDLISQDLSMQLKVYNDGTSGPSAGQGSLGVVKTDTSSSFQPLGRKLPIVVTEGYKGDTITMTVIVQGTDFVALQNLLDSGHTLFLQSNVDACWWVRPYGSYSNMLQPTAQMNTNPLRFVTLTFLEVDPEVS